MAVQSPTSSLGGVRTTEGPLERTGEVSLARYGILLLELGLFLVLVYGFDLESRAFLHLGILAFGGFAVHYFLPRRARLPFFVLLSVAGVYLVFGFQVEAWKGEGLLQATWLVGIALGFVALCHLPGSFALRVSLVLIAGTVLALVRVGVVSSPWSAALWPVLGAMLMFRLILYLYHLRHLESRPRLSESLAYFLMLPTVCFPLFPVVDFRTFRESHYASPDRHATYQRGMVWMMRGVVHLLLYRLVYHNLTISARDVASIADLLRYLIPPFLLYLRISGLFHIIVGLLHLFGFHLPETHNLYFLSSSFTDFWRRINIYWKDFMMRVVYYPGFMRLKGVGQVRAMVAMTGVVFAVTWLLHTYQWFWLQGRLLLAWNDVLFWLVLAVLVSANVAREARRGRHRTLDVRSVTWATAMGQGARAIATFAVICVLWSFWSEESTGEWLAAWSRAGAAGGGQAAWIVAALAGLSAVGLAAALNSRGRIKRDLGFYRTAAVLVPCGLALALLATPQAQIARQHVPLLADLRRSELNARDFERMERGYYENLLAVNQFNPELWEVYRTRPADWVRLRETPIARDAAAIPYYELLPSAETLHNGVSVRTNAWGMRDSEVPRTPERGTMRIALLGSSFVMGSGVDQELDFESLVEERASRETGTRVELLNFGVAGYTGLEHAQLMEDKVVSFQPHAVVYVAHRDDGLPVLQHLAVAVQRDVDIRDGTLRRVAESAGLEPDLAVGEAVRRLEPYRRELLASVYSRVAAACAERGIRSVWVYMPRPEEHESGPIPSELRTVAEEAGFDSVLALEDVYAGHKLASLWVARWDHHPNVRGHELIAEELHSVLFAQNGALAEHFPPSALREEGP